MRSHLAFALCLAATTSLAAAQGPPPGIGWIPIDSLPFRIERPGGYYLTESITWNFGSSPITVDSDQVALNLNGFALIGGPGSSNAIQVLSGHKVVSIANGSISAFGGNAVIAQAVEGGVLQGLVVSGNGGGIQCGPRFTITECVFRDNVAFGLICGGESVVTNCVVSGTVGHGFSVGPMSVVTSCTATRNRIGFEGSTGRSSFHGCTASTNTDDGFNVSNRSLVENCLAENNAGDGIEANFTCTLRDNSLLQNGVGGPGAVNIRITGSNCSIQGNHCFAGSLVVSGVGCTIVRNTLGAGTYSVPAGNLFGPVITANQLATNTNPHANYLF